MLARALHFFKSTFPKVNSSPLSLQIFSLCLLLFSSSLCGELVEITSLGVATQTSEYNGGEFPAANAVDGALQTFSHTDGSTPNNAWFLSFSQDYEISRIEVVMRGDCCGGRLTGSTLRLTDAEGDSVYDAPLTDSGTGQATEFELPAGVFGKQLRLGFESGATNPGGGSTLVHLGEVRVFSEIDTLPQLVNFEASPATIISGASVTLSWEVAAADAVELLGVGLVSAMGSQVVTPSASAIYTLNAANSAGSRSFALPVIVDGQALEPVLSEFMASNSETLIRSDGSSPDWIEIWNPNPFAINLGGYRLSDDAMNPAKYQFPSLDLTGGERIVVDASLVSRDGVPSTGFTLGRALGNELLFSDPVGEVLQSFSYPEQRPDLSYGAEAQLPLRFYLTPTPGEPNSSASVEGLVEDTQFSVRRGFFTAPQTVSITTATPGAIIYITTDGSPPSPINTNASVYTTPIVIAETTVLRAAAYRDGYLPTNIDTQSYFFVSDVFGQSSSPANFPPAWVIDLDGLQADVPAFSHYRLDGGVLAQLPLTDSSGMPFDLESALLDIPTMSLAIDSSLIFDPVDGLHVNARNRGRAWERSASIEYLDSKTGEEIQAECGVRMHGGWNRFPEMLKKSMRLYFRSEYGDSKFSFPLFGENEVAEFDRLVLRSGNGKAWASPWRDLSGSGNSLERVTYFRDQFVRDLQRATGNPHIPGTFVHLYINGHYWGLYNPVEAANEDFASARFGGDDEDYDVIKFGRGIGHQVAGGDATGWNELIALSRDDVTSSSVYNSIASRLDLPSFVDYMLVNFFVGNSDWIDNNVYAMRNRVTGSPFRFYCWDAEESFLSLNSDRTTSFVSDTCAEIHQALRSNQEYRLLFADRAQKHFADGGALSLSQTVPAMEALAETLDRAIVAESARWGSLLRPAEPYDRNDWLGEVSNLQRNFLPSRLVTVQTQLANTGLLSEVEAPEFSPQRGGLVSPGFEVSLSSSAGTVYYTLDGTDPRLPGGQVSSSAAVAAGPFVIISETQVRARALDGNAWSALDEAVFTTGDAAEDLVVSEIMYHPFDGDAEFLEITNQGAVSYLLAGLSLSGGIEFDFSQASASEIAPGERLLLVRDLAVFNSLYPAASVVGEYGGTLSNGGESFSLLRNGSEVLWTVSYDDRSPWPEEADGSGRSLVFAGGLGSDREAATSWRPSLAFGGSPGGSDAFTLAPNTTGQALLEYADARLEVRRTSEASVQFVLLTRLGADAATAVPEWSETLDSWNSGGLQLVSQEADAMGNYRQVWQLDVTSLPERLFARASVSVR